MFKSVLNAVRNNTTITLDFLLKSEDGGIYCDIPAMIAGGGDKEFAVNETVKINLSNMAHKDATLGYSVSFSFFGLRPGD